MRLVFAGFLLIMVQSMAACSYVPTSPASTQLILGKTIYNQGCAIATCHGENGEGISNNGNFQVWPLVGSQFQQRNPNAQVIYEVVRSGGEPSLRALTDQQIYDAIAYELSLNGVDLSEPLTVSNALFVSSGSASIEQKPGTLYPPPGNTDLITESAAPILPAIAQNYELKMRLTQIAITSRIEGVGIPAGTIYVLAVFTLDVLIDQPIQIGPQNLFLVTKEGEKLEPLEINLDYPVARFYPQTIEFEHGTAALAIFSIPQTSHIDHFIYVWPSENPLNLDISY
jgi:hypothetical protein